jgi:hypothetical protein
MQRRSRFALVVLATVVALTVSSCWQIRRAVINEWQIAGSERARVTLDLAKDSPTTMAVGYPFVMVGYSNLRNAGRQWDLLGNFGGKETGVKDPSLKQAMLNGDATCNVGGASIVDIASGYTTWVAFRMSSEIDLSTTGDNAILRFKHALGVGAGVAAPAQGSFFYVTGIYGDDGDLIAEPGEVVCQSVYNGTIAIVAP